MTKTLTLEGDISAADTLTRLTTQGSVTLPSLVVPAGVSKITQVIAAVGTDQTGAGSCVWFIRLGGAAVQGGEQTLMFAASSIATVQSGSDQAPCCMMAKKLDVDIAVKPDVISASAEMAGSDLGEAIVVVTLVFA